MRFSLADVRNYLDLNGNATKRLVKACGLKLVPMKWGRRGNQFELLTKHQAKKLIRAHRMKQGARARRLHQKGMSSSP